MEFYGSSKKRTCTKNFGPRSQPQKYPSNIQFNSLGKHKLVRICYFSVTLQRKSQNYVHYKGSVIHNCVDYTCNFTNPQLCNSAIANLVAEI